MIELHIMCGIQGSGKTTFAKELSAKNNIILYNYDVIAKTNWRPKLIHFICEQIKQDLCANKSAVYDDMNLIIKNRELLLSYFKDINCKKIIHVMNTPLEICLQRHHKRAAGHACLPDCYIELCSKKYEPPTLDEGWDEIIYHNYAEE